MLTDTWSYTARAAMNTPTMHSTHPTDSSGSSHHRRWFYILLSMDDIVPIVATDRRTSRHVMASMCWTCWVMR